MCAMDEQKISEQNMIGYQSGTGSVAHDYEKTGKICLKRKLDVPRKECHMSYEYASSPYELDTTYSDQSGPGGQSSDGKESPQKRQKLTLECNWPDCKKVFHKRRYLEDHIRSHTGERPFICEYQGCYKSYTKKEHLKRHQNAHNPGTPRFNCPHCSQSFTLQANLTRHINRTHDDTRFPCTFDNCEVSFKKNFQLKSHLSKVHGVKPFVCSFEGCGKEFSQKYHFTTHLKSHKGYDCSVEGCGEHFDTWSAMRNHIATGHSQEHACETCGKSFPSAQYKAHLKQHKKQRESFLCTYQNCHKAYFDRKNLVTHIKVFHEQAKFPCTHEGCQATLVTKLYVSHCYRNTVTSPKCSEKCGLTVFPMPSVLRHSSGNWCCGHFFVAQHIKLPTKWLKTLQKLKEHLAKIHDPTYVQKQKLKQKKRRRQRVERHRKEKAVNDVVNILLHNTEIKLFATSRREFEGREVGDPQSEVALRVVNAPGKPNLMDIVSSENSRENSDNKSEHTEVSTSSGISSLFHDSDDDNDDDNSDCDDDSDFPGDSDYPEDFDSSSDESNFT